MSQRCTKTIKINPHTNMYNQYFLTSYLKAQINETVTSILATANKCLLEFISCARIVKKKPQ